MRDRMDGLSEDWREDTGESLSAVESTSIIAKLITWPGLCHVVDFHGSTELGSTP